MAPKTRLFIPEALSPGARVRLSAPASHHLVTVLRTKARAPVALFNGRDGEWSAEVTDADRKSAELRVGKRLRAQTREPAMWLAFAPVKRAATDLIVEKATELGATRLMPVVTARGITAQVKRDRLAAIARAAAEQCGRLSLPEIDAPLAFDALLTAVPEGAGLFFCDERGQAPSLLHAASTAARGVTIALIGPEGGFSPDERKRLLAHPAVLPVTLGAHILRAETAAIAALAILQATHRHARDDLQSDAAASKCLADEC